MSFPPGKESFVNDFAAFILKMMNYNEDCHVVHS
jgi:hypothetical protein